MAKSFDIYGDVIRSLETSLGGAWVLHTVIALSLGFLAAWSAPKYYYSQSKLRLSLWVWVLLLMVVADEVLQAFNPLRQFSFVDLGINISCVLTGALIYHCYLFLSITNESDV
nr:VanZ family protein [Vibrio sp. RE86]